VRKSGRGGEFRVQNVNLGNPWGLLQDQFEVHMGAMYSRGVVGIKVGEFESDCDAREDLTFEIPTAL
jgi:hypothetical protein